MITRTTPTAGLETRRQLRTAALAGARDIVPVLMAVLPLAVVIGVAAHRAGVDPAPAWAASFLLCAGSAQLTAIELLGSGAAPVAIVATTTLINSRFLLYSAGLASWFREEPRRRRLLLAFPLVDQLFVVCQRRFDARPDEPTAARRWYYLGAAAVLVVGWSATQAVAITFAPSLPPLGVLQLAAPLVFVGLLTSAVKDRPGVVAALVGATGAVLAAGLPFHTNLAAGIVAGLAAGLLVEARARRAAAEVDR